MPQYTHTTLAQAQSAVSARLNDPNCSYWSSTEVYFAIVESLRIWNSLTGFYRQRVTFDTTPNTPFYDLTKVLPAPPFGLSVTDTQLVREMQFSLLEPSTGTSWTGTPQFNLPRVSDALQRLRNQYLLDTGILQTYRVINVPPTPIGRVQLSDDTVDVRRCSWISNSVVQGNTLFDQLPGNIDSFAGLFDSLGMGIVVSNGTYTVLFRDDEWGMSSWQPAWTLTRTIPITYSVFLTPPVSLQLAPIPADKGLLELISVQTGAALNPAAGVVMGVPDDFCWAVKWGAMADVLGQAAEDTDLTRESFCRHLYQAGVEAAIKFPSLLMSYVNDEVMQSGSVFELDTWMSSWQNSPGTPQVSAMTGRNLLSLGPMADGVYGITLDVVGNMPVPAGVADYIQVGRETLETIYDLSQCLLSFKQGGKEFTDTIPMYQNVLKMAGLVNRQILSSALYASAMLLTASKQEQEVKIARPEPQGNPNANS